MVSIETIKTEKGVKALIIKASKVIYCTAPYCTEATAKFIAGRIAEWQQNPARLTGDDKVSSSAPTTFEQEWRSRTW